MSTYDDIMMIENGEGTEQDYYKAIQRTVNGGSAWQLQGSFGRSLMHAIESGYVMLGRKDARDYYGNHIPSRTQVEEGTKGSRGFVVKNMGEAWATMMESVDEKPS